MLPYCREAVAKALGAGVIARVPRTGSITRVTWGVILSETKLFLYFFLFLILLPCSMD